MHTDEHEGFHDPQLAGRLTVKVDPKMKAYLEYRRARDRVSVAWLVNDALSRVYGDELRTAVSGGGTPADGA